MSSRLNTRGLRKQIAGLLGKSDSWLVLRTDKEGLHLHAPDSGDLMLMADFLASQPGLLDIINDYVQGIENATEMDCGRHGMA